MSEEALEALMTKRDELVSQVRTLHSQIFTINETIRLLGYEPGSRKPGFNRFQKGELMALVGKAERDGMQKPAEIADYIIQAKGWDFTDKALRYRTRMKVKDCLKRLKMREMEMRAARERQLG